MTKMTVGIRIAEVLVPWARSWSWSLHNKLVGEHIRTPVSIPVPKLGSIGMQTLPVARLFCGVIKAGPPDGAQPRKAGGFGEQ